MYVGVVTIWLRCDHMLERHNVIVLNVKFPNVTIPKLVKIPNINRNPTILPLYMPDPWQARLAPNGKGAKLGGGKAKLGDGERLS
jgi:hypothetical protein